MTQVLRAFALLLLLSGMPVQAADVQRLLDQLSDAENASVSARLQADIWDGWINGHANDDERMLMSMGLTEIEVRNLKAAEQTFTELIEMNPDFVEAWNKRATIRYMVGDLDGSELDVFEVLSREPRHFGAISGLGLIKMQRGNLAGALRTYESLLEVHPFSNDAITLVPKIRKRLGILDI